VCSDFSMKKVLHVLTRDDDELAETVVVADRAAGAHVEVIQLSEKPLVYQELLEAIFAADSVQSW
jgi:hypothetical protein